MSVILVTGASSGIGHATAKALVASGHTVVATARRPEALADLIAAGATALRLDVTDEQSARDAIQEVLDRHGRLDVLINNAGVGPLAAIEDTAPETWRRVFDTNVFGLAALARLALPHMRAQGGGRIVNVGSMGGEFTTPLGGAYHASKYAVEAITDALRAEVKPFGVTVALVQPGPVRTPMVEAADEVLEVPGSAYATAARFMSESTRRSYDSGRGLLKPEQVAAVVATAATTSRPRDRYKVGVVAHALPFLRRTLPLRSWDAIVSRQTGLNRIGRESAIPASTTT